LKRAATCVLIALIVACTGGAPSNADGQAGRGAQSTTASGRDPASSRRTAITSAVERVAPAVVTVQTETRERVPVDMFEMFFGGRSGERTQASIGSGFIVRPDGVVVTNAHVVSGATTVSVALRDGTTYEASVVGVDEQNDIAVLRIDARNLPVAPLGDSSDILVGEWAIAIGNPFGFVLGNPEPSVTAGVISGTGRNLLARASGGGATIDMIQTDAAINPGNSGGPLVNASGEVIGVNTVIYSPTQGSVGLGFAVPINRVKRVTDDLLAHGAIRRPWIGVKLQVPSSRNPRDAIALGAVVASVVPGSPADAAGLRSGDQILRIGGQDVRNYFAWESALLDLRVGDEVPLRVKRGDRQLDLRVRIADLPEVSAPKVRVLKELELVTLTPAIRAERGIQSARGALVYRVSDAITQAWGIQAGDVIVQINRTVIGDASAAARAIEDVAGRRTQVMWLERNGTLYSTYFEVGR
jgi:serine protease Do